MRGPTVLSVIVAFAGSLARADAPREIGEIQERSSSITVLRVNEVADGRVRTTVEEVRGAPERDEHPTLQLPITYAPAIASRLIRWCVIGSCPEWVGIERGGFHVVRSIDPSEDVAPGFVDDLGSDAHCLRARVLWLDQPSRLGRLEGTFDARTGHGLIWGGPVGRPRQARVTVGSGLGPWIDEAVTISVEGGVRFVGGPLERHRECYHVDLIPAAPLARTPAQLTAVLARRGPREIMIARGIATIDGRISSLTLAEAADGRIIVRTPGRYAATTPSYDETRFAVTVQAGDWLLDLDGISPPLPGAGVGSAIALTLRLKRELRGTLRRLNPPAVGEFVLRP